MDFKKVVSISPGTTGKPVAPPGGIIKAIFSSNSQLTIEQWSRVETALQKINNDCMGGRLVDTLRGMKVTLKHDKGIRRNGNFERGGRVLSIKDFNDTTRLERTLLHELVHAAQPDNPDAQLNREIEARVGTFRYTKRNEERLPKSKIEAKYMEQIDKGMDSKYNITDPDKYSRGYERVMNFLMNNGYGDRTETAENRNFNTVKALSSDC